MTDTKEKPETDTKAAAADTVEPKIAAVRTDVKMPEVASNRGKKSVYGFDDLAVGASIGVLNKTAAQLKVIVYNATKRFKEPEKDAEGKIVYQTTDMKNPTTGEVTKVPTTKPKLVNTRKFSVFDVDPKTDPDGATARIFREL